jgi:hypothetical protein
MRVSQFVLLTYVAGLAVALAAQRYERLELARSRSMVLAHVRSSRFRTLSVPNNKIPNLLFQYLRLAVIG